MEKIKNPILHLKKWFLTLLVPLIEGNKKNNKRK